MPRQAKKGRCMSTAELVPTRGKETGIVKLESFTAAQIFGPGFIDPVIDQIESEVKTQAARLDISTESNRKALASLAYKVGRSKTFIDSQRKALVADEKKRLKAIDSEGARIWDRLESLQAEVRKPLTDWEEADKQRICAHEENIRETEAGGAYTAKHWQELSVEVMTDRLNEIKALSGRDWQEFASRGALAIKTAVTQIEEAIAKREKYDAEQAELARLRAEAAEREQKEREERIAQAAREKAEREAKEREERAARQAEAERQRIENERVQAEARAKAAEEARIAAAEKAKRDAEEAAARAEREKLAAIEAERRRVATEEQRKREEQERLENNRKHRAKIHNEMIEAFSAEGWNAEAAKSAVSLIAKNKIPHVSITY